MHTNQQGNPATDAELLRSRGASREGCKSEAQECATSSNRAHTNPNLTVLRYGTDSLFLSFKGALDAKVFEQLSALKTLAQSDDSAEKSKAQIQILDHVFEVTDKGATGFSFCIKDNAFFIKISKGATSSMPFISAQISSEYLSHVNNEDAYNELCAVISHLGKTSEEEKISRADLFVDFTTDFDFSQLTSKNIVCRSNKINWREDKPNFTGFDIGLGGKVAFRLYDKTCELKARPRPYLLEMWKAKGWNPNTKVWRAEFETKRTYLKTCGVDTVDFLGKVDDVLWQQLSWSWLRLVSPKNTDQHRERWTTLPIWEDLHMVFTKEEPSGLSLEKFDFSRIPSDDYLYKNGLAGLTSFMARNGYDDPQEAFKAMLSSAENYHQRASRNKEGLKEYLQKKQTEKKKRFNKLVDARSPKPDLASYMREPAND